MDELLGKLEDIFKKSKQFEQDLEDESEVKCVVLRKNGG
jgi:hypothetical protein